MNNINDDDLKYKDLCIRLKGIFPEFAELKKKQMKHDIFQCKDEDFHKRKIEFTFLDNLLFDIENTSIDKDTK